MDSPNRVEIFGHQGRRVQLATTELICHPCDRIPRPSSEDGLYRIDDGLSMGSEAVDISGSFDYDQLAIQDE